MRRTLLVAAALCLLFAGCSDNDDKPSATSTTAGRSGGSASADPFCQFVVNFNQRFGRVDLGLTDPQRFRVVMTEAAAAIRDAEGNAPAEIRGDVAILNTYFQRFVTTLQGVNFDLTRLPPGTVEQFQNPEFTTASDRLDEYVRQKC